MSIFPDSSHRFKLRIKFIIALVGMSIIPLVIALAITIFKVQDTQRENIYTLDQQVAQTASEEVKSFIISQFKVLDDLGNVAPEFSAAKDKDSLVERVLFKNEDFVDLALVDTNGMEISRKNILKVITPSELQNRAASEEFQAVKDNGYYIGSIYLSNGKPYFLIGEQILSVNRDFQGAAFAIVDVRVMQNVVKNISAVGETGRVFIVDQTGKLIAHPDISQVLAEKNFSSLLLVNNLIHGSKENYGIYKNELGQDVLGSGVPISINFDSRDKPISLKTNWYVVAEQPVGIALASVYQITQFNIVVLLIILVASGIGTIVFSKKIVSPIEKLYLASKKFGEGQLDYRLDLKTGDELEDLAEGFDSMATKLQQNIAQLTSQNKLLMALQNIDSISLSTKQVQQVCQGVVDGISQRLGYVYGGVALVNVVNQTLNQVARTAQFDTTAWLDRVLPVPFNEQKIPLSIKDNLLVRSLHEKQNLYSESLFDIQKGLFSEQLSQQLQMQLNMRGIYVYPLVTQDQTLGVIYFISSTTKDQLSGIEQKVLSEYANEAARAIESALLYENLRNERELIAGERNKLAITLSGISDAVIAVDLMGRIMIFNNAAEAVTGCSQTSVIGKPIDLIMRFFDEEKELVFADYCQMKEDSFEGTLFSKQNMKLRSAKDTYVNMSVGQIKNHSKFNVGGIITLRDLSKERQLEEMKLDFVSMAAHELRTPLTSIKGYLYVFLRNYRDSLNQEQTTFLTRMNIATQRLAALVENLLNVTKIERGAMTIHLETIDWIENARLLSSELADQAKDKNIEVIFNEPEEKYPQIQVDKFRVNEVLSNLLSNAIAYTRMGGKIKIWFEKTDKEVITHVEDNGPGIPSDALPHLFTKFFRVSGKLEQGSKGTGLGLYISKSIIEMHKGRIWVDSELDHGSTFSFALPITPVDISQGGQVGPILHNDGQFATT